ncbi:MAG: hypothetical protein HY903_04790 [Deltaproteobacteria bacterium]|nr:hypothetical protein [Deltaproteobacteria bacterium]
MTKIRVVILAVVVAVLAGVGAVLVWTWPTFAARAPAGFAAFDGWRALKAVSPEGVVYRVRQARNEPRADLPFWCEALKKRMQDAGYTFVAESQIKAGGAPGCLLDLAAPQGTFDYSYLTAVFVDGRHLVIAEAAGEVLKLNERKKDIVTAIAAIDL